MGSTFEQLGFYMPSGARIIADDPWSSELDIRDIARVLSRTCRFGATMRHEVEFYGVAQHSVLVSGLCSNRRVGLLHDGGEAIYGDVTRPWKRLLSSHEAWSALVLEWDLRVGKEFGLGDQLAYLPLDVQQADDVALATEFRDMYYNIGHEVNGQKPLPYKLSALGINASYNLFIERFKELF